MHCPQCGQENPPSARFCSRCGALLPVPTEQSHPTTPPATEALPVSIPVTAWPKAGFWIRLGAAIIDWSIISAASFVLAWPLRLFLFGGNFISLGLLWLYFWLMTGLNRGQTLGKMAVGIRVIDVSGNPPTLGKAALREIVGKTVSALVLYIGYLMIPFSSQKRGLHDIIAETYVVSTK